MKCHLVLQYFLLIRAIFHIVIPASLIDGDSSESVRKLTGIKKKIETFCMETLTVRLYYYDAINK